MIDLKLVLRNIKRDIMLYILLIVSSSIFIALIISFQSTLLSGDFFTYLTQDNPSDLGLIFRLALWSISITQYIVLFLFMRSYYRFINKYRIRELAIYKITGLTRKTIMKLLIIENLIIFLIISIISIAISLIISPLIISFTNSYLQLSTRLEAHINLGIIFSSCLLLFIIICINIITIYRNVNNTDLKAALDNHRRQMQIKPVKKSIILINFICSITLLTTMTYLSTIATVTLKFGIILLSLFYLFGLILLISVIVNGYKYLFSSRKLARNYNLLLINETNYHLNKSKTVILTSVIFMMLSIGALLVSNVLNNFYSSQLPVSDYRVYDYSYAFDPIDMQINIGDNTYDYYKEFTLTQQISSEFPNQFIADENYIIINQFDSSDIEYPFALSTFEQENINIIIDGNPPINLTPILVNSEDFPYYDNIYLSENTINNIDSEIRSIKTAKKFIKAMNVLDKEVAQGNLIKDDINSTQLESTSFYVSIMKLSDYNQYLEHSGQKPVKLNGHEAISYQPELYNNNGDFDFDYVGSDYRGISANVVNDEYYNELVEEHQKKIESEPDKNFIDQSTTSYYNFSNPSNIKINEEIDQTLGQNHYGIVMKSQNTEELMGNMVFLLLIAFYIAIIFIVCNFTLIGINLLSHGIDSKSMYIKLQQLGLSTYDEQKMISRFTHTITIIPLIIGIVSGIIATFFALQLLGLSANVTQINYIQLFTKLMILYLILTLIFNQIIKIVYRKIVM